MLHKLHDGSKVGCAIILLDTRIPFVKPLMQEVNELPYCNKSSIVWKDIVALTKNSEVAVHISSGFKWSVVSGTHTSFWLQTWCSEIPLKQMFPRLYNLCNHKRCNVAEGMILAQCTSNNRMFRRELRGWEINNWDVMLSKFSHINLGGMGRDQISWNVGVFKEYTVKNIYELQIKLSGINQIQNPLLAAVWRAKVPPKICLFGWCIISKVVPTADMLIRRNIIKSDNNFKSCPFCKNETENINHLFFHCPRAWEIWGFLLRWWGVCWVMPSDASECIESWIGAEWPANIAHIWGGSFFAVVWELWTARNGMIFKSKVWDAQSTCTKIQLLICNWAKYFGWIGEYSANDLLRSLQTIVELSKNKRGIAAD